MRLDKCLKVSRIIKRRAVANEACDNGRVTINGRVAKAGTVVNVNDEVTIAFGDKLFAFRILSINENAKKEDTASMYEIMTDKIKS